MTCWQTVPAKRNPVASTFMSNQQSLGIQLAQLGRDASAAGAARRVSTHRKNVEIESVGVAAKSDYNRGVKKYFRLEFLEKEQEDVDEGLDISALENGYVAVTPFSLSPHIDSGIADAASDWISASLHLET